MIATHLALEDAQKYLELVMLDRDNELGTRHHRSGGRWNDLVTRQEERMAGGQGRGPGAARSPFG